MKDLRDLIARLTRGEDLAAEKTSHSLIFPEVLKSDLPPEDKANRRMADEA